MRATDKYGVCGGVGPPWDSLAVWDVHCTLPSYGPSGARCRTFDLLELKSTLTAVQGHLTCKKTHPPRTLLFAYAEGPRGVLEGWVFLMSKVPL